PRRVRRPRRGAAPSRHGHARGNPRARRRTRVETAVDGRGRHDRRGGAREPHRLICRGRLMAHFVYLVRHGEQLDAEHGLPDGPLSPRGARQAQAIAERLGGVPFTRAFHSPLQRAEETAAIVTSRLPSLTSQPSALLMDCIPSGPTPDMPKAFAPFCGGVTPEEIEAGEAQMADAVAEFLSPTREDQHDLLITHNFVI